MSKSKILSREPRVIIIGGGIAGITHGIALKQQLGFKNFTIYEQASDLGGTWRDNTYPGCASDVPTHWYSLSTELNPHWNQTHILQPALLKYWQDIARKHQIYLHTIFNTKALSAEWNTSSQYWVVEFQDATTKRKWIEESEVVIAATGVLCVPHYPEGPLAKIQNDVFKGEYFHSARWDHSVDLRNKRVAVIGNGCSAAQLLPIITEDPTTQVINFCRGPNWFVPRNRSPYSAIQQWIFAHIPFVMRLHRWYLMTQQELLYLIIFRSGKESWIRQKFQKNLIGYIKSETPEKYHDMLVPKFPFGCKRMIVDTGYLSSLHRSNFDLNYDGISDVVEDGIITRKGEKLPFDIIILATGFIVDDFPFPVRGLNGKSVQQYYQEQGGPTAYLGTAIPGFPNFYTMCGPNSGTGHASVIFTEEVQINYTIQLIKPIVQRLATSFSVTSTATDDYNGHIQKKLSTSVWSSCLSWYRKGHEGKITSLFPGTVLEFWWRLRKPKWEDFEVAGGEKWVRRRRITKVLRSLGFVTLVGLGGFTVYNWDSGVANSIWKQIIEQVSRHSTAIHSIPSTILGKA